jgi:hypothetical protein
VKKKFLNDNLRGRVITVLNKEIRHGELPFKFKYLRFMVSDNELISTYKAHLCTLYTKSQHDKDLSDTLVDLRYQLTSAIRQSEN